MRGIEYSNMKRRLYPEKFLITTTLVIFLLGIFLGGYFHKETVVVREGTPDTPAAMTSVNLMIDGGDGIIKTWNTVSWHEAMSIVNLLETIAGANGILLLTEKNNQNELIVKSIDGISSSSTDSPKKRWQYWVNNTYEPRVASKYYLKPGDIVVWKYTEEQSK